MDNRGHGAKRNPITARSQGFPLPLSEDAMVHILPAGRFRWTGAMRAGKFSLDNPRPLLLGFHKRPARDSHPLNREQPTGEA